MKLTPRKIRIEPDAQNFLICDRLQRQFTEKVTTDRQLTTDDSESAFDVKSRWDISLTHGFEITKMGEGTANPACDYDIEFIHGCPHQCHYCQQLEITARYPFIAIYPDLQKLYTELKSIMKMETKRKVVFETGNLTDMVAMDRLTGILSDMTSFWANELDDRAYLQVLTKSDNIENLLSINHQGKVRIGYSINLPDLIRRYETYTATFPERLNALHALIQYGYPVHISFSPIIYRKGIELRYEELMHRIKSYLQMCPEYDETKLSLEVLVMFQSEKNAAFIRKFYPQTASELLETLEERDGRLQYPEEIYDHLIRFLTRCIKTYFPRANVLFIS